MSIKNWIVTTERVKNKSAGLSEYTSYLISSKHKNHKNTEIYGLFNSEHNKFITNTIKETIEFDAKNKKGGRKVESFAQSFNFILPPPHKPTPEQWQDIGFELLKTVHSELGIKSDFTKFARACFVNVHDQANPHINMLIPRIYNGERLADLDRKNLLAKVKLQFNKSVLEHCNIDHTQHNPLRVNMGRRKSAQGYAYTKAKEEAQNALKRIAEANIAVADADVAQKNAEVKIKALEVESIELDLKKTKLNFFIRAFKEFRLNLTNWVESIRNDSPLDTMINRGKLEKTANKIVESKAVDDENAELVINLIDEQTEKLEKANFKVSKPEVQRRNKPKAG
jgi:hypothetical protein